MIKLKVFILMIIGVCIGRSEGSISIQVPTAGNCGDDTVLTCQVTGNIGFTGWYGFNRSIMSNGNPVTPEDANKYTETKGTSSFTLTIHNTDITDAGDYRCSNGFDESSLKRLNIECKASSATHVYSVTRGRKVELAVDKLYPASPTFQVTFQKQNSAIQISGSKTCSSSTQYSDYYRCVWTSSNSLDDGSYTYSLVVTTITQASPLTGSFKIVSPGSPEISNASGEVLYGNEGQPLTIQCTSNGGYPVPTVTWYKNSISNSNQLATTSSGTEQSDGTYTVNLQHTFTPAVSDDRKSLICRSYYPQADSGHVSSNSKSVSLYLTLKPSEPTVSQVSDVTAGNAVTVRCRTSGGRPAASISWLYQGVKYSGSTTSTEDATTETFTVVSTFTRQVTAADNGQSITCIVTHPALVRPTELTKSVNLNVLFSVGPSTTQITGNKEIIATGSTPFTLTCTTGSSNPASDITWKNGSDIIDNGRSYTESSGENNGVVRSQQLVFNPTRYMDGDDITCSVSNTVSQSPVVHKVKLNLKYSPLVTIEGKQQNTLTEGENKQFTCKVESKPISTIKWYHGNNLISEVTPANSISSLSLVPVNRTHYGSYSCKANNGIGAEHQDHISITVRYPPDVTVTATNTTVNDEKAVITCNANGVPNSTYKYGKWIQTWPGYNIPIIEKSGSEKLELTDLTYEYSGIYTCSVSNGVQLYGTGKTFMEGSVYFVVRSFPIIVDIDETSSARLNMNVTVSVRYYSNVPGANVSIYRNEYVLKNKGDEGIVYTVTDTPDEIDLPVSTHFIKTKGTKSSIVIKINTKADLGSYFVVVSNELGSANRSFEILLKGPPDKPVGLTVDCVQYNKARLSWERGFDGGLDQTFVLQLSTDEKTWIDNSVFDDGIFENHVAVSKVITDLRASTTYFVRMYSYNDEGTSPLTGVVNFTTSTGRVEDTGQSNDYSAVIVGIVLGTCIAALATYAIYVTILLKRNGIICQRKDVSGETCSTMYANMVDTHNRSTVQSTETETNIPDNESQYTQLNMDLKNKESAYEAISSM